jgi:protein arginine N-methyltransferase 1
MPAYEMALRNAVIDGSHVIDLGAGTGIFALLACRMGASQVTVLEPDVSIEIARRSAEANGFIDRIHFVRDLSTNFVPSERADILVSDIRGALPLFENHIPTIRDARERLLKPGGLMIPAMDRIYCALVEAPALYKTQCEPWQENKYGFDLSSAYHHVINSWFKAHLAETALLTKPQVFTTLDYYLVEETNYRAALQFETTRPGTVHGILMWFETELAPGIGFSNAPGEPEQIYGQAFFPLEQPVTLAVDAPVKAEISAHFVNGDYVWSWTFRATDAEGMEHAYRQSTFKGTPLSNEQLAPRAQNFRPRPRKSQEVDIACLAMFDGEKTLAEISLTLFARFPDQFRNETDAFERAATLSARYNS